MLYIIILILLYAAGLTTYIFMPKFKNTKITNLIFALIISVCYFSFLLVILIKDGFDDWNFQNALPIANISPFMFFITPFIFILPIKIRKYFYLLISLLGIGMFLSPTIYCIHYVTAKFHLYFVLDYIAHFTMFLFGIYLIKSHQIDLKLKDSLISSAIIVGVCVLMMIVNVIFDTAFFGLSLNGKHNIYNQVLVSNSYLSALIFFCGLILVLIAGYFFHKLLNRQKNKEQKSCE